MNRRYLSFAITLVTGCVIVAVMAVGAGTPAARADTVFRAPPISQNWAATDNIPADNDWSQVQSITGCSGVDPSTTQENVAANTVLHDLSGTCGHVKSNQSSPNGFTDLNWSVAQFRTTDGGLDATVAIRPQTGYDFPHLLISVNATGRTNVRIQYNVRDIDGSGRDAEQQVSLQYRIGKTGNFIDVPTGYVADATDGSAKTKVTPVNVSLPAWDNVAQLEFRILTTNRSVSDEWVGIDDISITATTGGGPTPITPTNTPNPNLTPEAYLPMIQK